MEEVLPKGLVVTGHRQWGTGGPWVKIGHCEVKHELGLSVSEQYHKLKT